MDSKANMLRKAVGEVLEAFWRPRDRFGEGYTGQEWLLMKMRKLEDAYEGRESNAPRT